MADHYRPSKKPHQEHFHRQGIAPPPRGSGTRTFTSSRKNRPKKVNSRPWEAGANGHDSGSRPHPQSRGFPDKKEGKLPWDDAHIGNESGTRPHPPGGNFLNKEDSRLPWQVARNGHEPDTRHLAESKPGSLRERREGRWRGVAPLQNLDNRHLNQNRKPPQRLEAHNNGVHGDFPAKLELDTRHPPTQDYHPYTDQHSRSRRGAIFEHNDNRRGGIVKRDYNERQKQADWRKRLQNQLELSDFEMQDAPPISLWKGYKKTKRCCSEAMSVDLSAASRAPFKDYISCKPCEEILCPVTVPVSLDWRRCFTPRRTVWLGHKPGI